MNETSRPWSVDETHERMLDLEAQLYRPDISRVVADLDINSWVIYAEEREALEEQVSRQDVIATFNGKALPIKGFKLTRTADVVRQINGGLRARHPR